MPRLSRRQNAKKPVNIKHWVCHPVTAKRARESGGKPDATGDQRFQTGDGSLMSRTKTEPHRATNLLTADKRRFTQMEKPVSPLRPSAFICVHLRLPSALCP